MTQQTLAHWLYRLESMHPRAIDLGLDRVSRVAECLQLQHSLKTQNKTRVITVAGTNGKGSCVATMEALLLSQGQTVGAYTSPHFLAYNERIRVNGNNASDAQIVAAFEAIEHARGDISLTYFEFGTLAALKIFAEAELDVALLEVGLGGRLDAVNIIDPDVAIVTSVDLDHQAWLGNDRETIGTEKAGIFRAGVPAICAEFSPPQSVIDFADAIQANLIRNGDAFKWSVSGKAWHWHGCDAKRNVIRFDDLTIPPLPLGSVAAAIQAILLLDIQLNVEQVNKVLSGLILMGRNQQLLVDGKTLLLDVAHNPAAVNYLAERLEAQPVGGRLLAIFAAMADKDCDTMMRRLSNLVDIWFVCGLPGNERAASAEALEQKRRYLGLAGESCVTVTDGLQRALTMASEDDRILVFGSFFTVAEVLSIRQ